MAAAGKQRMPNSIFPLPLAAFEEYMLRDDRPKHPMSIIAQLRFAGQLDRRAAAEALQAVVARHPLLRAKVQKTPAGRLAWVSAEDHLPSIRWFDSPQHDQLPFMRPIDLFAGPGLKVWAAADSRHSSLSLQVHHAACDGKAVVQVADDFLRSYAVAVAGQGPRIELSPCDAESLRSRGTFGLTALKYLRLLPSQLVGLLGVGKFLMRRPVPLLDATDAASDDLPASFPAVRVGRLEADEVRKLSAAAADAKATVNDWLLRDFFAAVADFRARHQAAAAREWIRFAVPMNLRQDSHHRMPAANVVSMIFLDRNPAQIADPGRLLWSIRTEMDLIRRLRLGLIFVSSLSVLRLLPGGLARRVNHERCEATCVFSNLGRVLADSVLPRCNDKLLAGNVVLEDIEVFAPVRDGTAVSVLLAFYAGELRICMHYDTRRITEPQACDLMAIYLQQIRTSFDMAHRQAAHGKAA